MFAVQAVHIVQEFLFWPTFPIFPGIPILFLFSLQNSCFILFIPIFPRNTILLLLSLQNSYFILLFPLFLFFQELLFSLQNSYLCPIFPGIPICFANFLFTPTFSSFFGVKASVDGLAVHRLPTWHSRSSGQNLKKATDRWRSPSHQDVH